MGYRSPHRTFPDTFATDQQARFLARTALETELAFRSRGSIELRYFALAGIPE
jgi:uncharacterized protein (DUF924 family)